GAAQRSGGGKRLFKRESISAKWIIGLTDFKGMDYGVAVSRKRPRCIYTGFSPVHLFWQGQAPADIGEVWR
ncbi:MAG TPA: hypothetical protein VK570_19010, partial [Rubrivivax sp.]|nr:hypothetical protein [Rubrivivax sp.]